MVNKQDIDAGWSSLVARWAHNPKVVSSNLAPATKIERVWGGKSTKPFFILASEGIVMESKKQFLNFLQIMTKKYLALDQLNIFVFLVSADEHKSTH